jgi:hypothetical protein
MTALQRFKRLAEHEQLGLIKRVRGGLIDAPPQFREMVKWYDEHDFDESQLPGGLTRNEFEAAAARRRAGMVDQAKVAERPRWRGP